MGGNDDFELYLHGGVECMGNCTEELWSCLVLGLWVCPGAQYHGQLLLLPTWVYPLT